MGQGNIILCLPWLGDLDFSSLWDNIKSLKLLLLPVDLHLYVQEDAGYLYDELTSTYVVSQTLYFEL